MFRVLASLFAGVYLCDVSCACSPVFSYFLLLCSDLLKSFVVIHNFCSPMKETASSENRNALWLYSRMVAAGSHISS